MAFRAGIKRREIPKLKAMLEGGATVEECFKKFMVDPMAVFQFAKEWGIKVKETPESLRLKEHEAVIEAEVKRRLEVAKAAVKADAPASKGSFNK